MASLTDEARKRANLPVLQRSDPTVLDIIGSASHVVLYEFQQGEQQWEKKDVDGSLFVVKKSELPRFQLAILNRSAADNWTLPILHGFEMQNSDPFLIFRQPGGEEAILGVWFHDANERAAVATTLEKVVKSLEQVAEIEKKHVAAPIEPKDYSTVASALLSPLSLSADSQQQPKTQQQHQGEEQKNSQQPQQPPVLDKKSLQLALLSLLQDDRFLDLIHAQYLKVAQARSNRKQPLPNK